MLDLWRADGDTIIRSAEERFAITEGYLKVSLEAASGLMKKCNLSAKDFVKLVAYTPDARRGAELARGLGFDTKTQLQDPLIGIMGNSGTPYPLMLLVAALEEAKPGDRILLASYGNGSDAFVLRVTEHIAKIGERRGMKKHLASKRVFSDYITYLRWRRLITIEESPTLYPEYLGSLSAPAAGREVSKNISFHGSKCHACGTVQYPPQRVCTKCHAKDQFEEVSLAERKGTIVTFSADHISSTIDMPIVNTIVDLEGGGRVFLYMTDREFAEVKNGMPVELTFRKLGFRDGIHNYYWKTMPLRV
jgi:uncharacterized OB-fold protein